MRRPVKTGGKNIRTATFMTDLGPITLEADEKGLTAVSLPPPDRPRTPAKKETIPDDPLLQRAVRQISEYLQGKRTVLDLPLTVTGTDFQKKVWTTIREIPYGRTLSYGEIARRLGSPAKARAVGGAAHANALPLVIPCHRVIGADGSLTGFGGGLELKKKLLDLEQRNRCAGPADPPAG